MEFQSNNSYSVVGGRAMETLKKKFGKRVRELRKSLYLTQEQVAETINIEPPNISKMENGLHFPLPENIEKLAKVLNVEVKELFDFSHILDDSTLKKIICDELNNLSSKELMYIYKTIKNIKFLK